MLYNDIAWLRSGYGSAVIQSARMILTVNVSVADSLAKYHLFKTMAVILQIINPSEGVEVNGFHTSSSGELTHNHLSKLDIFSARYHQGASQAKSRLQICQSKSRERHVYKIPKPEGMNLCRAFSMSPKCSTSAHESRLHRLS